MMKIQGLDKMMRELDQLSKAMQSLDGDITSVKFDPEDPESIEQAIQKMEAAVDERAAPYLSNKTVRGVVEEMKEKYRHAILERAAEARVQGQDAEEDGQDEEE